MEETQLNKKGKLPKNVLNVIRTTMRNNIELTHIADNKANVLLSLNALMLTFLTPMVVTNFTMIISMKLVPSLIVLVLTCLITIYLSALALKPGDFSRMERAEGNTRFESPFFFGNMYKLTLKEFESSIAEALMEENVVRRHITQDLYYLGSRLGQKMKIVRIAFNFFLAGLILAILIAAFVMIFLNNA